MLTVLPHTSFPVKQFGPATTTASGSTPGAQTSTYCLGSLTAASPNDIARLEEGKRTRQAYKLITGAILNTAQPAGQLPDWVEVSGNWFEVSVLISYQNGVMSHYEYIIVKIENPQDYQ
jgi:hypothetical protein